MPSQVAHSRDHDPRWIRISIVLMLVYAFPIALLTTGALPFRFRFHLLLVMAAAAGVFSVFAGHTLSDLGIRLDNMRQSLVWNASFTALVVFILWTLHSAGAIRRFPNTPGHAFYVFYVLLSCPSQEFLFRAFLWAELEKANCSSWGLQLAVLVIPYTLAHLVYRDPVTLLIALLAGLTWSLIYRRTPNWFGVTLSHSLAGLATIAYGLI